MTVVKICGIRRPEHAVAAAEARADFVGMIFAKSRRQITLEQAREIIAGVRARGEDLPKLVGVFADQPLDEVNRIAREAGLDRVQLSGHEDLAYARGVELPLIKAVKVKPGASPEAVRAAVEQVYAALDRVQTLCLLEPEVDGAFGGAGARLDPAVLSLLEGVTFLLAGGLIPDTVGQMVRRVRPWGVDVSSGVETDGVKDNAKIARFIFEAKRAGGWRP